MRPLLPLLLALGLGGCSSWIDQEPSCGLDVYEWSDDLLGYILAGPGDGTFDLDPVDTPRLAISGSYDYESGDFSWVTGYESGYWLRSSRTEGFGTAFHNGDLDIYLTETATDVLDAELVSATRVTRTGCSMTTESFSDPDAAEGFVASGAYASATKYEWEAVYEPYTYTGTVESDLTSTLVITTDDDSYWQDGISHPDGTTDTDWRGECYDNGYECVATQLDRFDGGYEITIAITDNRGDFFADYSADYDYDGAGVVHWAFADGTDCDLDVGADGSCVYTCSDGSDGDCS